jgi:hypothetical protein
LLKIEAIPDVFLPHVQLSLHLIELSYRSFDKIALLLKIEAIRLKEQEAANLVEIERNKKS